VTRPRSLALIAVVAFVLLAAGSLFVFGTKPLSGDEQAHLFQARLFAQFKVIASYPPELLDRVVPAGYQNSVVCSALANLARGGRYPSTTAPLDGDRLRPVARGLVRVARSYLVARRFFGGWHGKLLAGSAAPPGERAKP
jgi:hypothetical protein